MSKKENGISKKQGSIRIRQDRKKAETTFNEVKRRLNEDVSKWKWYQNRIEMIQNKMEMITASR